MICHVYTVSVWINCMRSHVYIRATACVAIMHAPHTDYVCIHRLLCILYTDLAWYSKSTWGVLQSPTYQDWCKFVILIKVLFLPTINWLFSNISSSIAKFNVSTAEPIFVTAACFWERGPDSKARIVPPQRLDHNYVSGSLSALLKGSEFKHNVHP